MHTYRKKPVVIEAVQWTGTPTSYSEICLLAGDEIPSHADNPDVLVIKTLEGGMCANVGDYIIKGVKGELYPCKPDIFEMTYEAEVVEPPKFRSTDTVMGKPLNEALTTDNAAKLAAALDALPRQADADTKEK